MSRAMSDVSKKTDLESGDASRSRATEEVAGIVENMSSTSLSVSYDRFGYGYRQ